MINVNINPSIIPSLEKRGFSLSFSECSIMIWNRNGVKIVEIIYDCITNQNIILTRNNFHYTKMVNISLKKDILKLYCRENKRNFMTINIDCHGKESIE